MRYTYYVDTTSPIRIRKYLVCYMLLYSLFSGIYRNDRDCLDSLRPVCIAPMKILTNQDVQSMQPVILRSAETFHYRHSTDLDGLAPLDRNARSMPVEITDYIYYVAFVRSRHSVDKRRILNCAEHRTASE